MTRSVSFIDFFSALLTNTSTMTIAIGSANPTPLTLVSKLQTIRVDVGEIEEKSAINVGMNTHSTLFFVFELIKA